MQPIIKNVGYYDHSSVLYLTLARRKYNLLEVIENFIHYLTGHRLDQEDALPVHSLLFEDSLLLGNIS